MCIVLRARSGGQLSCSITKSPNRQITTFLRELASHHRLPVTLTIAGGHARCGMPDHETAIRGQDQSAGLPLDSMRQPAEHHAGCLGRTRPRGQPIRDLFGNSKSHNAFPKPCHGDGSALVICVDARADQRAVPYAARQHESDASGRGPGRESASPVEGNRTNSLPPFPVLPNAHPSFHVLVQTQGVPRPAATSGMAGPPAERKVSPMLALELEVPGEPRRRSRNQEDVLRLFHHQASRTDRVANTFNCRDRPGPEGRSFHDRRVHTTDAVQLEPRSHPRIEQARSLKDPYGLFHRGERGRPLQQECPAGDQGVRQADTLHLAHGTMAGAAMGQDQWTHGLN